MIRGDHIPALDGIRGFAAMLVVVAHFKAVGLTDETPAMSGPLGVMLFFILSGFLMAHLYLGKPFDRPAVTRYFTARVARVLPLYYGVIVSCYALTQVFGRAFPFRLGEEDFFRLVLLSGHNYVFWSIPPEVQFYGVFALLWWLIDRARIAPLLPLLAAAVAAIFLMRPWFPGISVLGQLQIFFVGVGVALVRRWAGDAIDPRWATVVQVAGIAAVAIVVLELVPVRAVMEASGWTRDDNAYASLPLALLVGAVLLAFTVDTGFARALFVNRLAERLGAFSFSIYLLHWPVMAAIVRGLAPYALPTWLVGAIGVVIAVAVSALVYHLYEMPMQRVFRHLLPHMLAAGPVRRAWQVMTGSGR